MEIPNLATYNKDGRRSVKELYSSYLELQKSGWLLDVIGYSNGNLGNKEISLPIIGLRTPQTGKSLWVISGIHGEESAGPNALAEQEVINYLEKLGKKTPMVLLPFCNPVGYLKNWRYFNQEKWEQGAPNISVGDSDHYLQDINNSKKARRESPICNECSLLTKYVVDNSKKYKPLMSFDFHEDDLISKGYVYSQGKFGQEDPIARDIVKILLKSGVQIKTEGKTRFNEEINYGIVKNNPAEPDGSIDELLATKKIIINDKPYLKPAAKTSIVLETPAEAMKLEDRKKAHMNVLLSLNDFLKSF